MSAGKKCLISFLVVSLFLFLALGSTNDDEEPEAVDETEEETAAKEEKDEHEEEEEEETEAEEESKPVPDPVSYEGNGDDVLTIEPPEEGPFLVYATGNQGERHFSITGFDAEDNQTELFVNTTKSYEGVTLDYGDTSLLEIDATGDWEIELRSIRDARLVEVPGSIEGSGDEVFLVEGEPSVAEVTGNQEGRHFSVVSYNEPIGLMSSDLLVNTTDPYEGSNRIDGDTELIVVTAVENWEISLE